MKSQELLDWLHKLRKERMETLEAIVPALQKLSHLDGQISVLLEIARRAEVEPDEAKHE